MIGFVEVVLHSTEDSAVRATEETISQLPGGVLKQDGGKYYVPEGFVAWAAFKQGYVKSVK